jgi:hypothetical protein
VNPTLAGHMKFHRERMTRVSEQYMERGGRGERDSSRTSTLSMVVVWSRRDVKDPAIRALLKLYRERSASIVARKRERRGRALKLSGQVEGRPLPESGTGR